MDRLELQKVNTELDEESNSGDSIEDNDADMVDSEKATISSHFVGDDAESQKFLANGFLGKKKMEGYTDEYHPGNISFVISAFNLSNAIMGSGILGLSYAMANTGIILFIILLFSVAMMSLYSVHLLLKTAKEGGSLIYEKLGEKAFGWPGKIGAFISLTMQNIGAMSSYLFIIKYELPEVIRAFVGLEENSGEWYLNGNYLVIFVSIGIILPLSLLKNLGYLGYTSGFSLTCMVFFLSVVIYKKSQIPCPLPVLDNKVGNWSYNDTAVSLHVVALPNDSANLELNLMMDSTNKQYASVFEETKAKLHQNGVEYEAHGEDSDKCQAKYFVFNSRMFHYANSVTAVLVLGVALMMLPSLGNEMSAEKQPSTESTKDSSFQPRASNILLYGIRTERATSRSQKRMQNVSNVSIMGMLIMYLLAALFGYLTFYGEVEDELLHTYRKVYTFDTLLLMVRLAVLVAVTLTVPIVLFPIRTSLTTLLFPRRPFSWIRHFLIAIVILIFNNLLVIFVPTIKDIFGFIGASAATMLIFILPAAFYLRIVKKEPLRSPQKIGVLIFLIVGIIFMFGSMILILLDWIYNSSHSNQH